MRFSPMRTPEFGCSIRIADGVTQRHRDTEELPQFSVSLCLCVTIKRV